MSIYKIVYGGYLPREEHRKLCADQHLRPERWPDFDHSRGAASGLLDQAADVSAQSRRELGMLKGTRWTVSSTRTNGCEIAFASSYFHS
jgi:hypothetical protein